MTTEVLSEERKAELDDQFRITRQKAEELLVDRAPSLSLLRQAASSYFNSVCGGRVYARRQAIKIMVPLPAVAPEEPEARLVIQPELERSKDGRKKTYKVSATEIRLSFCELTPKKGGVEWCERIETLLCPGKPPRLWGFHLENAVVNAERMCTAAEKFLAEPEEMIAASGDHCCFCGKPLTDPESRRRGVGPECFERRGDLMAWIQRAPTRDMIPGD